MPVFKKRDPFKAPWPPGSEWRVVKTAKLGTVVQLRDGEFTPPDVYREVLGKGRLCAN